VELASYFFPLEAICPDPRFVFMPHPSEFNEYTRVHPAPCPPRIRKLFIDPMARFELSYIHCESNSGLAAVALWEAGELENCTIVAGLAKVPLCERVNDPENWRVHVWLQIGDQHYDPTYELCWQLDLETVKYFQETSIRAGHKQLEEKDYKELATGGRANLKALNQAAKTAENFNIPHVQELKERPDFTANLIVKKIKNDKLHHETNDNTQSWHKIQSALNALDGSSCTEVIIQNCPTENNIEHPQLVIFGGNDKQYCVEKYASDYSSHKLVAKQHKGAGAVTLTRQRHAEQVDVRHIVTLEEVIAVARELCFKGIISPTHDWDED
jgi:hypothetical protein